MHSNKHCPICGTKGKTAHDRAKGKAAKYQQNKAARAEANRNGASKR